MKRVGFLMKIKADVIDEYAEHHANVWPDMLDALRRHGWRNYSIFARDDGMLFGYVEVPESFENALEGMAEEEVNDRWQDFMAPYFEIPEGSHPDQNMIVLTEVFHTD